MKYSAGNLKYINQELLKLDQSKEWRVTVTPWEKKRSVKANSAYQSWYGPISDYLAMTIPEATRYVKLTFGLPILFSNKDFGGIVHAGLDNKGFFQVNYERQLQYMDKMPVTRLFTTKMHNKLRDDLQYFFGQQGLALEYEK
jgi:hypothetical protein